jgi:hypothetical protein
MERYRKPKIEPAFDGNFGRVLKLDVLNRENCPKHHSAANQLPEGSKSPNN